MNASLGFADLVVRPTIVLLLAGLASLVLRRRSAASRHLVWSAALCGILVIPVLGPAVPAVDLPVGNGVARAVEGWLPRGSAELPGGAQRPRDAAASGAMPAATSDDGDAPGGIPWRVFWIGGLAVSLAVLVVRYASLRRIERAATPADGTVLGQRLEEARRGVGIDRTVRLLLGEPDAMPMTWGIRAPRILLPAGAVDWPAAQADAVLLHELAHVRRGDVALQRCAELARAVFWFNPLAWLAARRMLTEREHACDDAVLRAGVRGSEYAHQLLAMAHSLRSARGAAVGLPMARRSQMTGRLLAILDEGRARWAPRGAAPPLALGLAALLALGVTAVHPIAAGAGREPPRSAVSDTTDLASDLETVPVPSAATAAGLDTVGCWHPIGPDSNHNKNEDPGLISASWSTRRCIGGLRITGRAVLLADSSGFAALSPGGHVSIDEKEGDYWRRIELTGRYDGQPELDGRFGDERAGYEEIDGWLRTNLRPMLRLTGVELEVAGGP
jgi:beta-lactamase regulating signal transducer with metallopeptidase domain